MHYISYQQRRFIRWLLLSLLSILLAACSTTPAPQQVAAPETDFAYVAKADIDATMTQAEAEAVFGGSAIVFEPEAGFAIFGFSEKEAEMTTLALDPNVDALSSPEVSAAGWDAWAGGWDAWAGGWDAWAGGWDAWAGGWDAWAGGWDAWAGGWDAWAGGSSSSSASPASNKSAFDQIRLDEAHALSRNYGEGVTVAVIDSGLDLNHPMFAGRLAPRSQWKDFIDGDTYPQEASGGNGYGHGTAAAGIVLQIAPKAKILPIRVLDKNGKGDTDDVIMAAAHAIQMGADIINLSVGSTVKITSLDAMIAYLNTLDVYVVASSGNNGRYGTITYPAAAATEGDYKKLISVSSVDLADQPSNFASHSAALQYFAPGENISSSFPGSKTAKAKGTSFAAPMVSGALALAKSELAPAYHNRLNKYLKASSDAIGYGDGRLNVEKLVRSLPGVALPEYEIVAKHSGKCLDVSGGSLSNGSNVQQWDCNGTGAQHWRAEVVGDYFKLTNVRSGKVLDVGGWSKANGGNLQQWTYGGGGNQLWQLKASGDSFQLVSKYSGKCADVGGLSNQNGGNIQQWGCGSGSNQKFDLRRVN